MNSSCKVKHGGTPDQHALRFADEVMAAEVTGVVSDQVTQAAHPRASAVNVGEQRRAVGYRAAYLPQVQVGSLTVLARLGCGRHNQQPCLRNCLTAIDKQSARWNVGPQ